MGYFLSIAMHGCLRPGVWTIELLPCRDDRLTRLSFGSHKVVANYDLANPGDVSKTFDAAKFDLKPGLYPIGWVLGCWRDQETVGPGRITVLMSHPGDQALQPVDPDDIVRPERIR